MTSGPGQTLSSTRFGSQLTETLAETSTLFNPEIESTKISTASMPWARLTTKSTFFKEIELSDDKSILGREDMETSSTSKVTDPLLISRKHFSITKEHSLNDFKIVLEDLSSGGTWKNCMKIQKGKKVEIKDTDLIGINCKATKASYTYKMELIKKPRRGSKRKQKLPENSQDFDFTSVSTENNKTIRMGPVVFASPKTRTTRSKRKLDDKDLTIRTTRSKSNDVSKSKGTSKTKPTRSKSCSSNTKRARKN